MASTMKSITQALGSVDGKKENLRKAFEDLQSHSSSLSSFTLQWKDLEDHFDSIKKSIEERFKELESKTNQSSSEKKSSNSTPTPTPTPTPAPAPVKEKRESNSNSNSHPELKTLCEKMDGIGLRSYILSHRKDLASIRNEVGIALQSASDPAKLVLDAMKGFYPPNSKGDKDGELAALRRTCLLLLEQLLGVSPQIKPDIKERAKKLAVEWKGKVTAGGDNPLEPLTLLQLLATYGLVSALSGDELLDMAVSIARRKQAVDLIRSLDITDKIPGGVYNENDRQYSDYEVPIENRSMGDQDCVDLDHVDVTKSLTGLKSKKMEDLYELYKKHANAIGFSVRKTTGRGNTEKYFCCSCQGKTKSKTPMQELMADDGQSSLKKKRKKRFTITRTNCKAEIRVKLMNGVFKVVHHITEHNHNLTRMEWQHLHRSERRIEGVKGLAIESTEAVGVQPSIGYRLLSYEAGGEEHLGHTIRDQ